MKVMTFNANGLRAAARKGFFEWFAEQNVDVLCVQEVKAMEQDLQDEIYFPKSYHRYLKTAQKPGYSGVAIYTRVEPLKIHDDFGWDLANHEGPYLRADFKDFSVISVYLPSGSSGDERQGIKYKFLAEFEKLLASFKRLKREFIICGDWNIIHKEIDIRNFKGNQKSSGCLPEERAWMDKILTAEGWVDGFREINQEPDQYTWWSQRRRSTRENNIGWRIDYEILSLGLKGKVTGGEIHMAENFSDHAPMTLVYDLKF